MSRNPQDIKKASEMDKLSALIIMFLVAAMVILLFMLIRGQGPG